MRLAHFSLSFMMPAFVILYVGSARADDTRCFEFTSPTAEQVFQTSGVQRLLIVLRFSGVDGQLAAKGLSRAARRHGIEATMIRSPEGASAHDLAVKESKANQAQMVAIVEISTGPEPKTATVEFRDDAGQEIAVLQSLVHNGEGCREAEVEVAQPRRPQWQEGAGAPSTRARQDMASADEGPGHVWYGWELILGDVASVLLLKYDFKVAAFTYALTPGVIHAANGQFGRAGLSFAIRSILPLAGLGLGALAIYGGACDKEEESADVCAVSFVFGLIGIGVVAAMAVDDAALAWKVAKDPDRTDESRPPRKPPGVSIGVGLVPYRQGAGLGMAGRF